MKLYQKLNKNKFNKNKRDKVLNKINNKRILINL
jgi:hypothetical protein